MGVTHLGSLTLSGDLIVGGTETITGGVTYAGNVTLGDTSADVITVNGTSQVNAPLTVGVDDTGYDVKFFGATAGKSWLWDESADKMIVTAASDLLGNTQQTGTLTVGVDDTGYDVQLFGATSGAYMLWDESADQLILAGNASANFGGQATITNLQVTGGTTQNATPRTPAADSGPNSVINNNVTAVDVGAVTNDANDWLVLPSLAGVQVGHTIKIACNAGTNFELRTPASSGEKINTVDSDGSAEYLCTDTDTVIIWKLSDADGWVAQSITALGAVRTAVIPDA